VKDKTDRYAGSDIELARRFSKVNWGIGTAVTLLLAAFYPPIAVYGANGWLVTLPGLLICVGGVAYGLRRPERISYDFLYWASWIGLAQLALLQWQAGGRVAPFHEFYLFQLIGNGLMHPPRRFAAFAVGTIAAAAAPAFYAPATARPGEIVTEMVLWLGLGVFLLLLMRRIRAQRVELRQAGEEASQLARLDPLTELGNRRAFDEGLEAALSAGRVSLIVADLNDFKRINDAHGHVAGDDCLRQVANALRAALREADRCYRWGGDEFAVIVGDASTGDAEAMAARLAETVASSCRGPDGQPLSLACGHAEIDGHATPAEALATADAVLLGLKRRRPVAEPA
jgi:diguanylate cyclase (GGDEF)-like protein